MRDRPFLSQTYNVCSYQIAIMLRNVGANTPGLTGDCQQRLVCTHKNVTRIGFPLVRIPPWPCASQLPQDAAGLSADRRR